MSTGQGWVSVWLSKNGDWDLYQIDDYFPCKDDKSPPLCLTTNPHDPTTIELWGPAIEKAYAKMYGGYDKILDGTFTSGLKDFTGAPYRKIHLEKTVEDVDEVLRTALKNQFIVAGLGVKSGNAFGL